MLTFFLRTFLNPGPQRRQRVKKGPGAAPPVEACEFPGGGRPVTTL